ncbi:hypothetical protein HETIRDRAFT_423604 [Heterobasidion irregulare TC 32-1]|uniref:Reverse transcriptase/retrotransposon-derived protein RNase H-like domain-containing protein n=1 Tax=Heterobasidion irregulare (strain TC 32-1) TaxID=747525 RepID=W4JQ64_HETIT|nr:uncharacterized protein HETIRDRAFT_423604 [Heterobasidion irregulare TC 32-1]ETW75021.1 hypothetical protein HETIRDRAFT_423604 [Heterobasidion irregulare TC 32-1]
MQILLDNNLFLKPSKCVFEVDTVKYLGFIISADSIAIGPVKVEGISKWPTPTNLKETEERNAVFETLKLCFTLTPVLIYPNGNRLFRPETNASDFVSGTILLQEVPGDGWHPVVYLLKYFNTAKQNYNIFDKELLVVIYTLDHWCIYLEAHWALFLSCFYFTLVHKPSTSH